MENQDLIRREALLNAISGLEKREEIVAAIQAAPKADIEHIETAHWCHLGGGDWCCSNCGTIICTEGSWVKPDKHHCEGCGAKMKLDYPEKVDLPYLRLIIELREPRGLFYCKEGKKYTGVDNKSGDAWTETFNSEKACIDWLNQR